MEHGRESLSSTARTTPHAFCYSFQLIWNLIWMIYKKNGRKISFPSIRIFHPDEKGFANDNQIFLILSAAIKRNLYFHIYPKKSVPQRSNPTKVSFGIHLLPSQVPSASIIYCSSILRDGNICTCSQVDDNPAIPSRCAQRTSVSILAIRFTLE